MQEITGSGEVPVDPESNLTTVLWDLARAHPGRPALAYRSGDGFADVTTKQFADTVLALAAGLVGLGIEPGARICVFSSTRVEFTYLDYAIWAAGCVTVPIYETSSADQVAWIASDSGAVAVFCENAELEAVFDEVAESLPDCRHLFVIDAGGLDELRERGTDVDQETVAERAAGPTSDDVATIVYTSGTTGRPKGCVLTHGNLVWDSTQVCSALHEFVRPGESTLLFLPLAHIFARIMQVACIQAGVHLGYASDPRSLREELPIFRPTFLVAVPRIFQKVYAGARHNAHQQGKGRIFDLATSVAIDYSKAIAEGTRPRIRTRLLHALFDPVVYKRLRAALGGRIRYAISGGSSLGARLAHYFDGIGVTPLEGYGLTETTAGTAINRPDELRIGTVGKPFPGVGIRIADDGEILVGGGGVFRGYWRNEEATAEALDPDGWFVTGDVGSLDDDGFLAITGRKKELIVTAGGKNVAPAVLEERLVSYPLISQSMVVGDGQPFIAALITIDPEEFERWAPAHGLGGRTVAEARDDPALVAAVQEAVDHANRAVSRAESIRTFRVLPEDLTVEGGELTPSLKVKRRVVRDKYRDVLEDIYGDGGGRTGADQAGTAAQAGG